MSVVVLGLPSYTGWRRNLSPILSVASSKLEVHLIESQSSLLTSSFNMCLAQALTLRRCKGATHFVLLHADVYPQGNWLADLLTEQALVDVDLLSVVSPIKDLTGDRVSVALESDDPWRPQVLNNGDIPDETWTHPGLLVNSGCMSLSLKADWVEGLCFTIRDAIIEDDGAFEMRCAPEDWNFSRDVRRHGGSIAVTRKVKLLHYGEVGFSNELRCVTA